MSDSVAISTGSQLGLRLGRYRRHAVRSSIASGHADGGGFGRFGQMSQRGPFGYSPTSTVGCGYSDSAGCNRTLWDGSRVLPWRQLHSCLWRRCQNADSIIVAADSVFQRRLGHLKLCLSTLYLVVIGEGQVPGCC